MTSSMDWASAVPREASADAPGRSLPAGGVPPRGEAPNPLASASCGECGHGEVFHDLNKASERTRCLTSLGPRGTRCTCTKYIPINEETPTDE